MPAPSATPASSDSAAPRYASPPPTLPPFNRANAVAALGRRGSIAQLICSGQRGPATIHLAVTFAPNGSVGRVVVAEAGPTSSPGVYCVQSHFWSLRVDPFTGPPETIGVAVALR